jgi:hypothetical protein
MLGLVMFVRKGAGRFEWLSWSLSTEGRRAKTD